MFVSKKKYLNALEEIKFLDKLIDARDNKIDELLAQAKPAKKVAKKSVAKKTTTKKESK